HLSSNAFTAVDGTYSVSGLPTGTYYAVEDVVSFFTFFTRQYYNNIDCISCGITTTTPISVTAGATTSNINFALATGGRLGGRVTDASTGAGVATVTVRVDDRSGTLLA